jgi:hypothetical protein
MLLVAKCLTGALPAGKDRERLKFPREKKRLKRRR